MSTETCTVSVYTIKVPLWDDFDKKAVLQDILAKGELGTDASGNPILQDVGVWMKQELKNHHKEADIKYIEPSYMIRSTPTISSDRIYCKVSLSPWSPCCLVSCRLCI